MQIPVKQIEAAVVRHFTSRTGDPHRHLHLEINARVWAHDAWRGLHTVGVRDSLEAINGIGHAAVMTNPEFRATLAAHGYTLDLETGEITHLVGYSGAFSSRSRQIEANIDRYEPQWRRGAPPRARLRSAPWIAMPWPRATSIDSAPTTQPIKVVYSTSAGGSWPRTRIRAGSSCKAVDAYERTKGQHRR